LGQSAGFSASFEPGRVETKSVEMDFFRPSRRIRHDVAILRSGPSGGWRGWDVAQAGILFNRAKKPDPAEQVRDLMTRTGPYCRRAAPVAARPTDRIQRSTPGASRDGHLQRLGRS